MPASVLAGISHGATDMPTASAARSSQPNRAIVDLNIGWVPLVRRPNLDLRNVLGRAGRLASNCAAAAPMPVPAALDRPTRQLKIRRSASDTPDAHRVTYRMA
jgi:hypothetical protein